MSNAPLIDKIGIKKFDAFVFIKIRFDIVIDISRIDTSNF
ncbi:Uncharacterised protein [Catenibacterium mitsuokai]|nr:Uncharacterised protein [Catenibacterium mitsuokai]